MTAIIAETEETATDVVLYITRDVYNSLPPHYRDNYHSSTRMGNITAHRRFKEGGLDCFVVSPIGEEDDKIRRRADFVFERYIKPACEATNYRARRSDMIISKGISKEMKTRLTESPMVVVYLGSPKYGWNPNVIWEFGFREGKGKPCILLKDRTVDGERYNMPFDIADFRFIDIPEDENEETNDDDYGSYIRKIREFIDWQNEPIDQADQCTYWHAGLTLQFGGGRVKIVEEMGDIADLIDLPSIHNKRFRTDIIPHLLARMPAIQAVAVKKQQMELIGSILWEESPRLQATIPIVFNKHKTKCGRAFLPVIVNHGLFESLIHVKVIFLEVTGVLKTHDDGYFYCDLAGQTLTDLPRAGDVSGVVPLKA